MTTESGARIYRRAPKPLAPGACPHCGQVCAITLTGRRAGHNDDSGERCTGAGVTVKPREFDEDAFADAVARPSVLPDRPPCPPHRSLRPGKPACPECGRTARMRAPGVFSPHRVIADDFTSPYCPGGSPKGRQ
jgi:hypothetical protein